ncbi:hypothetical protein PR048_019737 [Dryococelus australis]|uniref:Ig-like domain-containing protein n=1 Tax=Dryococelus australis TaxID=614101 RepID=A0ABQ9H4C1_9NEOP|nr:hypothetical protein PR048_019737 [Dryococelus australis]
MQSLPKEAQEFFVHPSGTDDADKDTASDDADNDADEAGAGEPPQVRGPAFVQEPPPVAHFSNVTGAVLSCSAHGSPPPDIRWLDAADKELSHVPGLRLFTVT